MRVLVKDDDMLAFYCKYSTCNIHVGPYSVTVMFAISSTSEDSAAIQVRIKLRVSASMNEHI